MELHVALGPPLRRAIVVLGLAGFLLVAYLLEGSPDDAASLAGLSFVGALVALRLAFVITTLIAGEGTSPSGLTAMALPALASRWCAGLG